MPLSMASHAPPPARWSSCAFTVATMLSALTRRASRCPSARDRSGNGVTPWSAVSTIKTFPDP